MTNKRKLDYDIILASKIKRTAMKALYVTKHEGIVRVEAFLDCGTAAKSERALRELTMNLKRALAASP